MGGGHDARDADQRVRAEVQRVEEVVVEPPVDHVDRGLPPGGAHPYPVAGADQVAALDQLDAHQPGQQGVFEVGRVGHARGEDGHHRIGHAVGSAGLESSQQALRVLVHRAYGLFGEEGREGAGHHPAVLDHVRDAGRHPDVVLQHPEPALLVPDQVDPGDVDADPVRRFYAVRRPVEVRRGVQQPVGHHTVREDPLPAVGVGEEGLQGEDPLPDAPAQPVPLDGVEQAGHQVEREGAFLAAVGVGHAAIREGTGHLVGAVPEFEGVQGAQRGEHGLVGRSHHPGALEHLVPRVRCRVRVEYVGHGETLLAVGFGRVTAALPKAPHPSSGVLRPSTGQVLGLRHSLTCRRAWAADGRPERPDGSGAALVAEYRALHGR